MNIRLPPELKQFVQSRVDQGTHETVSEVMRDALRLMRAFDQQMQAPLRQLLQHVSMRLAATEPGVIRENLDQLSILRKYLSTLERHLPDAIATGLGTKGPASHGRTK